METTKITIKKLRKIYNKVHRLYYLNSILNKILLGVDDFNELEKSTLSLINQKSLYHLKKELLSMIPPQ